MIEINKDHFIIILDKKINKLNNNDLIDLFCIISALLDLEKNNELEKATINIRYKDDMMNQDYINILGIVRGINFYSFIKYFKEFEEKFNNQNINTKLIINDYSEKNEIIDQKIILKMIFEINIKEKKLLTAKEKIKEHIKINKHHKSIFKLFK